VNKFKGYLSNALDLEGTGGYGDDHGTPSSENYQGDQNYQ